MQISRFQLLVASAGFVCLMTLHAARVPAAVSDSTTDSANVLNEIVVTATKRVQSIQTVPLTVSVVSQDMLQSQNLVDTSDLKRLVPDLQFVHGVTPGGDFFGIRGISTFATGQGLEQSAGVAFDGVPLGRNVGSLADLVDIQRVEVLKGPQGMLFGKNASAGLLNIVSNAPELGKTEEILRASFGSLNLRQYSGTVNLPVTEDSALRISAWKFEHDGPVHLVTTGQDLNDKNSEGARLKYRWRATDALDLNFTGEWNNHDENGQGYTIRFFDPANFTARNGGAAVEAYELGKGTVPSDHNLYARGPKIPYFDKGHTAAYTGQADYSIGNGTLSAIASYRTIYSDDEYLNDATDSTFNTYFKNEATVNYNQLSEEIRYTSPVAERLRYVVGLFNFRMKLRSDTDFGLTPVPGLPVNDNAETNLTNRNYAGFGEATFDITSQWHLIAGLRRSTDSFDAAYDRTVLSVPNFITSPGGPFAPLTANTSTSYNDLSWRTGLQYQFMPEAMLYFTVSRGYKGPGISYGIGTSKAQLAATNNGIVKPEIAHNYELGLKSQWFDRRLTVNVALYNAIFDNFQTSVFVPSLNTFQTQNAGQAKTTGVDLDASWLVTHDFSITANATYDNARYTDFRNAQCYGAAGTQTVAKGCINSQQNLDGHRLANTPVATANLTARYEHPLSAIWNGFLAANYSYRSGVVFSTIGDPLTAQGGYGLVNLTAGVNTADNRWGISVYGKNVLNKHYVDYISYDPTVTRYFNDIGYDDLRNYGIALTARF
ncbi:MAG: TonB-dependent receptor [Pseudomonadota bacterium]|nr:TonB-dependent receptor [Pseudomonadota bacterium]